MDITWSDLVQKTMLEGVASIIADTGDFKAMLFSNSITPSKNTVKADLVEANFTGYARKSSTPSSAFRDATGAWRIQGGDAVWLCNGTGNTPQTIYGIAYLDSGNVVTALGLLDAPQTIGGPGDGLSVDLGLTTINVAGPNQTFNSVATKDS